MKSIFHSYFHATVVSLGLLFFVPFVAEAYLAAPIAQTLAPTYLTEKSAQLNGKVNPNEMPDSYQWFEWGIVGRSDIVYETPRRKAGTSNKLVNTNATIVGLAPNMQYFYRQVAENGRGKDIGMTTYFTTKKIQIAVTPILIVETNDADTITGNSAMLHGYVSPHGNSSTRVWYEWGTTMIMENQTPKRSIGSNSVPVQISINGLTPGTTYFSRLVGENALGQVYGATRVFVTRGTAPVVKSEAPRSQNISSPTEGDSVARTTTTSGNTKTTSSSGGMFDSLFGKKTTQEAPRTQAPATTTENDQVAGVGASSPAGTFWNTLTGKKTIEVTIEKIGPKNIPAHTPIEYRVTYAYRADTSATGAKLKVILPENVIYIGDNTDNELLLEETAGPERTYVLPVGRLEKGTTRTISMLGMTTGAANGAFPDARARLEYTTTDGGVAVVSAGEGVLADTTSETPKASSSGSILPSSFIGWLLYILLIVGSVIAIRKAKAYYVKRKEAIEKEEEFLKRKVTSTMGLVGNEVAT